MHVLSLPSRVSESKFYFILTFLSFQRVKLKIIEASIISVSDEQRYFTIIFRRKLSNNVSNKRNSDFYFLESQRWGEGRGVGKSRQFENLILLYIIIRLFCLTLQVFLGVEMMQAFFVNKSDYILGV